MRCNGCALMPHLVHHVDKKCIVQSKSLKRVDSIYLEGHLLQPQGNKKKKLESRADRCASLTCKTCETLLTVLILLTVLTVLSLLTVLTVLTVLTNFTRAICHFQYFISTATYDSSKIKKNLSNLISCNICKALGLMLVVQNFYAHSYIYALNMHSCEKNCCKIFQPS